MTINPKLEKQVSNSLPKFSKVKVSQIQETVEGIIQKNKEQITELCSKDSSNVFDIINQLQQLDNKLDKYWSPVRHLNSVMNSDELREVYTACLPLLSDYHTELGQHRLLYEQVSKVDKEAHFSDDVQRKIIDNMLKIFILSGINLPEKEQENYKRISSELSKCCSKYSDNVLDATNAWSKKIETRQQLDGLPPSAMDMVKTAATQREQEGWLLTLDFPIYNAVLSFADDRSLREELYTAFTTKASDQGDQEGQGSRVEFDNARVMEQIIQLSTERANILGFKNYAEQSLYRKMAESPSQIVGFLEGLLKKVKPQAVEEIKALQEFASSELNIAEMQAWDLSYVSEKLKKKELDYSEEDIKPWFSVDSVLAGLFEVVQTLYGCQIQQKKDIDVWHEDVTFYEILDKTGEHIASFYLDLYARQHKRGGAWMDSFCGRYKADGEVQIPVAYMTCNSSPPSADGKPALFTHNEVITLFHEFGHGLHHMLTKVDYLDVSGISGVEWDAVELPSQFMENWCWQRESLDMFAKHYETDEQIPDDIYQKMLKTRHFNSALGMLRQIEFGLFDMKLHMDSEITSYEQIADILKDVRKQTSLIVVPAFNRFQNAFSHIFAGGYAAGYYSYLWAEVLSADAFGKFEETGIFNQQTAELFLSEILEKGGSRTAKESFISFMGREPDISALLRHSGIRQGDHVDYAD